VISQKQQSSLLASLQNKYSFFNPHNFQIKKKPSAFELVTQCGGVEKGL